MTVNDERKQRRHPRQARAQATWEAILEAAAQILERRGPAALNTNAVAERAGVSIGTLYQYFADKRAILVAAARRERASAGDGERRRALIEALIAMLDTLGGVGGAASAAGEPAFSRRAAKPGRDGLERRLLDLAHGWLVETLTPSPVLRPIPIPRRGDRR